MHSGHGIDGVSDEHGKNIGMTMISGPGFASSYLALVWYIIALYEFYTVRISIWKTYIPR